MGPWLLTIIVLVTALGLLLNAYVLLVVLGLGKQNQQQQTANTLLLIHLSAVETLVCLVVLLLFFTDANAWCVAHGFLLALLHPVALWTVTGLNCDRYYAIAAPLHYSALVSPRRVVFGLIASWTGALLLCLPPFSGLVAPYRFSPDLGCCTPDFGNGNYGLAAILYGAIYAFIGLVLPATLVTVCNMRVLGIARYHRHRIASAIYEVTLSAQVTITHQRNPFFVPTVTAPSSGGPPRFHSAASTVMQLVGSLYLLYIPYCGVILYEVCGAGDQQQRVSAHPRLTTAASILLACSPPVNGLLYGLKSRTLRRSVQNYWRKKATKSELQQEIQARTPSAAGSRRPSGSGANSFFPFPPLQRRLSEALLALGTCRTVPTFEGVGFHRARLQPAASCNTLRVPALESEGGGRLVRASASAVSLMGDGYRNEYGNVDGPSSSSTAVACDVETPRLSPRILITRACSEESQENAGTIGYHRRHHHHHHYHHHHHQHHYHHHHPSMNVNTSPADKRRWRHFSTGSDSSTGSSDAGIWTTCGPAQKKSNNLTSDTSEARRQRRATRCRLARGEVAALLREPNPSNHSNNNNNNNNNSESSDTTDTTTVTTTNPLKPAALELTCERDDVANGEREPSESDGSWSSVDEEAAGKTSLTGGTVEEEEDDEDSRFVIEHDGARDETQLRPLLTS